VEQLLVSVVHATTGRHPIKPSSLFGGCCSIGRNVPTDSAAETGLPRTECGICGEANSAYDDCHWLVQRVSVGCSGLIHFEWIQSIEELIDMTDGSPVSGMLQGSPEPRVGMGGRIQSVDVLRGLTILLMVFVNDLAAAAPAWMHHIQPPNADGMTLADIVFPAFLFLVGMSIPLAFERARAAGRTQAGQLAHVLARTAGLLLMGVLELNRAHDQTLARPWWAVLAYTSLIFAWCALPRERGSMRYMVLIAKVLGIAGLVTLLAIYRREPAPADFPFWGHVDSWSWMRTGWWGILGLIGWAYLTVGLFVLLVGWRREWLMGAMALLFALHLALNHGGLFARTAGKSWLGPEALEGAASITRGIERVEEYVSLRDAMGSLAAITMAGCMLGTILRRDSDLGSHRARVSWGLTFVAGLILAGFVTDTFEGINKIAATPTWCLWSAGLTCLVWVVLYLVLDAAGLRLWSAPIRAAGSNALVAYLLHPILLGLISLAGLGGRVLAYKKSSDVWVVIGGSAAMAAFVCALAGLLGRVGVRMRL
jgi:predicted acyltransferase